VRHGGASIAEITRIELGPVAGRAMMAFIWLALVYVIVAFADITAQTFVTGRGTGTAGQRSTRAARSRRRASSISCSRC
jgi:carbon starvation protein CstA